MGGKGGHARKVWLSDKSYGGVGGCLLITQLPGGVGWVLGGYGWVSGREFWRQNHVGSRMVVDGPSLSLPLQPSSSFPPSLCACTLELHQYATLTLST